MLRLGRVALGLSALLLARTSTADSITSTNDTIVAGANVTWSVDLRLSAFQYVTAQVLALTPAAQNVTTSPPSGTAVIISGNRFDRLNSSVVAYISCDATGQEKNSTTLLADAQQAGVPAVILYSETSESCIYTPDNNSSVDRRVYSSKSKADSSKMVNVIREYQTTGDYVATLFPPRRSGGGPPGNATDNNGYTGPLGASPSTAVAMIVLYAITGLITILFIIIIITGAVRAHRHPERYGPRTADGRPRQTRAGGLARAVLDSIPIVKFGDRQQKGKPRDIELASTVNAPSVNEADRLDAVPEIPRTAAMSATETDPAATSDEVTQESKDVHGDGIAAATGRPSAALSAAAETEGCSICTEDFQVGQDQRVLPCNHRFHPACIDPWLLNVSGTCPMCRIDLRPSSGDNNTPTNDTDASGEPASPLSAGVPLNDRPRRSVLMAITGLRRPDGMTPDERISALRRYRQTHNDNDPSVPADPLLQASDDNAEVDNRTRHRLSRVFNVRTWRTTS